MEKLQNSKYENVILEIIKKNERYQGNEDLLQFIYDDVVERLGGILDTITDEAVLRTYIERIAKLSIITVTKRRGSFTDIKQDVASKFGQVERKIHQYHYDVFEVPQTKSAEINLSEDFLMAVEQSVMQMENDYPTKDYIKIYKMRFVENKSLEEISEELNVSQAQVAERLFDLTALVKENL